MRSHLSSLLQPALATLMLLCAGHAAAAQESREPRRRSVLFYLIDTCRADRMSVYGNPLPTTPFLERIAREGVVFERCYSQAPWTKPSMASILTSRYPGALGIHLLLQRLDNSYITLPEVLRDSGYRTAGFAANPLMGAFSNYAQGFQVFVESTEINQGDPINFASGSAAKLNDRILPFLEEDDSWPNFLYVHSVDPHEEYEPAPEFLERFADPDREKLFRMEWKKLLAARPPVPGLHLVQDHFDRAGVEPGPFIDYSNRLYQADLAANDAEIERLWEALQEDGWGEDCVLVVMSDHGEEFFEHGGTSHGYSLYEELIHVPLILYAPGLIPAGLRIERPVRSLDVYPTLCDLLGLEPPEDISGQSLVPLLSGADDRPPLPVMSEKTEDPGGRMASSGMGMAMSRIEGRWKLISNLRSPSARPLPRHELFDLVSDPGETRNLADEQPERVARMEAALMEWSAANMGLKEAESITMEEVDPRVLEQLRALGYVGDDDEDGARMPDMTGLLSPLARAVLEADDRWVLHALEPIKAEQDYPSKVLHGYPSIGRRTARGTRRESLMRLIYRGIADSDGAAAKCFLPRHAVQASNAGHTVELLICYECSRIQVYVDGTRVETVKTDNGVEPGVSALFEDAGLEIEGR